MSRVACILPAAGSGRRMGGDTPKPLLPVAGTPIIARTVAGVRACPAVAEIVLVLPADDFNAHRARYAEALGPDAVDRMVPGGTSRQQSVARGLAALASDAAFVSVHDAVRPFATPALFARLLAAAEAHDGALPCTPATDTLKRLGPDGVLLETVPRADLVAVQTPQVFRRNVLEAAYAAADDLGEAVTDDASVVQAAGGRVAGVPGERTNLKITTPEDLRLAAALLAAGIL
ncbi:MAG: 2-C-methyl-D-erythritol 4-phosphate cytidylyltransferase [Planctomycetota bacterium]